jgi:8-oxo-dGTP pyrophosphatase MutT (NUDIX family)
MSTTLPDPTSPVARSKAMRAAASMLVLRDGTRGMEVLMMRRPQRDDDRSAGAFVFPGGTLDPGRHVAQPVQRTRTPPARGSASRRTDSTTTYARCEKRSRKPTCCSPTTRGQMVQLDSLAERAPPVARGGRLRWQGLAHVCEMLGLRLAVDRLAYSAYWLTPPGLPKRFDTRFFMAMLPSGQTALHDGVEAVEHRWLRPAEAIDPASNFTLVNATRRILQSIAHFQNAQTCFDFAQQRNIPLVMPRLASGPKGQRQ